MTKLFSLFIILSFVLPVSGQEKLDSDKARKEKAYHLTGSVREQGERPYPDPLPDVNIQLYSLPDTSFIEGTVSDKKGVFRLYPMNPGNYLIRASFLGYETIEKKVNIPAYRKEVYGGALMMKPSSIVLDETVIKAELQKMKMSGDTLVIHQTVVHILSAFRGLADGTDIWFHICRILYRRKPSPQENCNGFLPSLPARND